MSDAILHVVPVGDIIEHDTNDKTGVNCVCAPAIEMITGDDRVIRCIITHHSADGRELAE